MIRETIEPRPDVIENFCFVNIRANYALTNTAEDIKKIICWRYGYNLRIPIDTICFNIILINSVLNN